MQYIRKVSIGSDYKSSMNYVVGQPVLSSYTIHVIKKEKDGSVSVYVENKKREIVLWKNFNVTMPFVIEYNINY